MTITLSRQAREDLENAYEYIAKENPSAADRFLMQCTECFGLLASGLVTGRLVELKDGRRVRTWVIPPYRVYYRLIGDEMQVARIYHSARRPLEK